MNSFLKLLYIAVVAIVVFTGALYIAEGMRTRQAGEAVCAAQEEAAAPLPGIPEFGEGSAL